MRQIYLEHINFFMLSIIIGGSPKIFIGTNDEIKSIIERENIKSEKIWWWQMPKLKKVPVYLVSKGGIPVHISTNKKVAEDIVKENTGHTYQVLYLPITKQFIETCIATAKGDSLWKVKNFKRTWWNYRRRMECYQTLYRKQTLDS